MTFSNLKFEIENYLESAPTPRHPQQAVFQECDEMLQLDDYVERVQQ